MKVDQQLTIEVSQAKQLEKLTPPEIDGFVTVTREVFYATVGRLDVHPYPRGSYDPHFGYVSEWRLRDNTLIAKSTGGTTFSHSRYMVTQAFYTANVAKHLAAR